MDVRICSYVSGSFLLEREPGKWDALVMLDSGVEATEFVAGHARSHLYLCFDDVEAKRLDNRPPTPELVAEGLVFGEGKERLIVCCRAGRGRSSAMAYLIACQDLGAAEAIKLLDPIRHRPNRLVVSIGDSLLGVANVLGQFDDWQRKHAHIRPRDYYDRLAEELDALMRRGATDRIVSG